MPPDCKDILTNACFLLPLLLYYQMNFDICIFNPERFDFAGKCGKTKISFIAYKICIQF